MQYVDMTGGQPTRTRVQLLYGADTRWRFEEVSVFDDEPEQAFAVLLSRSVTVGVGQATETDEALPKTGSLD